MWGMGTREQEQTWLCRRAYILERVIITHPIFIVINALKGKGSVQGNL